MRMGFIYIIINHINGKIYIGKTFDLQKRWNKHVKCVKDKINRRLYDGINKYGVQNFSIHSVCKIENEDKKELTDLLNKKETSYIKIFQAKDPFYGYNMADGGDGGYVGEEGIEKMAIKKRGISLTKEHKNNIGKGNKGISKPLTQKTKDQIRDTCLEKGIKPPIQYWGAEGYNDHPMLNKHHSKESRDQMSKWRAGKTYKEIYGDKKTQEIIENKRKNWIGENNPKYVYLDISKAIRYIIEGNEIDKICEKLNIKYHTLLSKIKKETGKTITQLRNEKTSNNREN